MHAQAHAHMLTRVRKHAHYMTMKIRTPSVLVVSKNFLLTFFVTGAIESEQRVIQKRAILHHLAEVLSRAFAAECECVQVHAVGSVLLRAQVN